MTFTLSEVFARGFDAFSSLINTGNFDRLLVRPRGIVLQVIGSNFEFSRIGRVIYAIILFIWSVINIDIAWNPSKIFTLIFMVLGGVALFSGIFILFATMCFWTVQGLEIANVFTDGGREMAQYPLSIYSKWIIRFFTFVMPFACFNYLPLMYVLGKINNASFLYMLLPFCTIIFLIPCLLIWNIGLKHYRSTGS